MPKAKPERERRDLRTQQLQVVQSAIQKLSEALRMVGQKGARHDALSSHVTGFYLEVDKLTKGKALMEVTPLVVEQANDIIQDSKAIVEGDAYLDRVKQFVPAGNNPVYPDVLVTIRIIRQSLERFGKNLETRKKHLANALREAKTINAAIEWLIETDEAPSTDNLLAYLDRSEIDQSWFEDSRGLTGEFNFDRLDRIKIDEHFSADDKAEDHEE
jgi:hypothetical protein